MNEIKFVSATEVSTLEEYAASLLSGMISLRTLESFHHTALKKGILNVDETETLTTICWEIQRLLSLYAKQMENVLERTELNEEEILQSLKSLMPDVKIPRKKRQKKEDTKTI